MIIEKSFIQQKIMEFLRDITSLGNPIVVVLFIILCFDLHHQVTLLLIGLLNIECFCFCIKLLYFKPRPNKEQYSNILGKLSTGSFPSIHAARITFIFSQFALIKDEFLYSFISLIVILLVCASRVILKKHFIIDVLVGSIIGFIVSLIIYNNI